MSEREYYFSHIRGKRLHLTSPWGTETLCGKRRPWMTDNERSTFGPGLTLCPSCRVKAKRYTGRTYA